MMKGQGVSSLSNNTQFIVRPTLGDEADHTEIRVEESNYPLDVKSSLNVIRASNGSGAEIEKGYASCDNNKAIINETSRDTTSKDGEVQTQTMTSDKIPPPFKNSILTGRHQQNEFADYYITSESQPSQPMTKRCKKEKCQAHSPVKKLDPSIILSKNIVIQSDLSEEYDSPSRHMVDYKSFKGVAKQNIKIRQKYQKSVDQSQLQDSKMGLHAKQLRNISQFENLQNTSGIAQTRFFNKDNHQIMKIEESDTRRNTQPSHFQNKITTMGFQSELGIANGNNIVQRPSNINVAIDYEDLARKENKSGIVSPQTHLYQSNNGSPTSNNKEFGAEKDLNFPAIDFVKIKSDPQSPKHSVGVSNRSKRSNDLSEGGLPKELLKSILDGQIAEDQHKKIEQVKDKLRSQSQFLEDRSNHPQIRSQSPGQPFSQTFVQQVSPSSLSFKNEMVRQERAENFINLALANTNSRIIKRSDQKKKELIQNLNKVQNALDYIQAIERCNFNREPIRQANQNLEVNLSGSGDLNQPVSDYQCTDPIGYQQETPVLFQQKVKLIEGTELRIASGEQSQTFDKMKKLPTTEGISLNNQSVKSLYNSQRINQSLSPRAQAVSPPKHTVLISTSRKSSPQKELAQNDKVKITEFGRNNQPQMKSKGTVDSIISQAYSPNQTNSRKNETDDLTEGAQKQYQHQILNEYFNQGTRNTDQINLDNTFAQRLAFKFGGEENAKKIIENSLIFHDFSQIYQQAENLRKINNMIPNYYREEQKRSPPQNIEESVLQTNHMDVCKVFESKFSKFSNQQSNLYSSDMQGSIDLHVSKIGEDLIGSFEDEAGEIDQSNLQHHLLRLQNKSREYGHVRMPFKHQNSTQTNLMAGKASRNSQGQYKSMIQQNQDLIFNQSSIRDDQVQSQQSMRLSTQAIMERTSLSQNFSTRNNRVSVMTQVKGGMERAALLSPQSLSKHSQSLLLSKLNLASQIEKMQKQETKTNEFNFKEQSLMEHNQNQQQVTVQRIEKKLSKDQKRKVKSQNKSPNLNENTSFMAARNGIKSQENQNRAKIIQAKNQQMQKLMNKTQAFPSQFMKNLNKMNIESSPESANRSSYAFKSSVYKSSDYNGKQQMLGNQPRQKLGQLLKYNHDFIEQGIRKMDKKGNKLNSKPSESVQSQSRNSFYEFSKSQGLSLKNIQSRGQSNKHILNPVYKHSSQAMNSNEQSDKNMKISSFLSKKEHFVSQQIKSMTNQNPQETRNVIQLSGPSPSLPRENSVSSGTRNINIMNRYSMPEQAQEDMVLPEQQLSKQSDPQVKIVNKVLEQSEFEEDNKGVQTSIIQKSKSGDESQGVALAQRENARLSNLNKTKTFLINENRAMQHNLGEDAKNEVKSMLFNHQNTGNLMGESRFFNNSVNIYLNAAGSNTTESTQLQQHQGSSQAQMNIERNIVSSNLLVQQQTFSQKGELNLPKGISRQASGNSAIKSQGICSVGSQAGPGEVDEAELLAEDSKITPVIKRSTIIENSASHDYIDNSQFMLPHQETNRTNKIIPSQESTSKAAGDTVDRESAFKPKKLENISTKLNDTNNRESRSGKQFAYQVQIHTNKKDQRAFDDQNSFDTQIQTESKAKEIYLSVNSTKRGNQMSSSKNILSPTMSNPLRNYQHTSHSNSVASGMTASGKLTRFNPAPVRNFMETQKIMVKNADIQVMSHQLIKPVKKPKESSSKLAKLNYILNTFDRGQHESMFQMGNFQGVQVTGTSSNFFTGGHQTRSRSTGRNFRQMVNSGSQIGTDSTTRNNSYMHSKKNIHSGRYTRNIVTEMQIVDEVDQIDESCTQMTREEEKKLNESVASNQTKQIIYQSKPGSKQGQMENQNSKQNLIRQSNLSLVEIGSFEGHASEKVNDLQNQSVSSKKMLNIIVDNETYENASQSKKLLMNKQGSSFDNMTEGSPLPFKLQSSYAKARNINQNSSIIDEKSVEHEVLQDGKKTTNQNLKVKEKHLKFKMGDEISQTSKGSKMKNQSINTPLSGADVSSPNNQVKSSVFEQVKSSYGDFPQILAPKLESFNQTQVNSANNATLMQPKAAVYDQEPLDKMQHQNTSDKDKWLFPQSMLEEQSELLKVVQKYRKKQRK